MAETTVVRYCGAAVVIAVTMSAALTATAPQATAGCEPFPPFINTQLCDGPIQPDGTWQRCETQARGSGYTESNCYPLGNNHFVPLLQPPGHIDS